MYQLLLKTVTFCRRPQVAHMGQIFRLVNFINLFNFAPNNFELNPNT